MSTSLGLRLSKPFMNGGLNGFISDAWTVELNNEIDVLLNRRPMSFNS